MIEMTDRTQNPAGPLSHIRGCDFSGILTGAGATNFWLRSVPSNPHRRSGTPGTLGYDPWQATVCR